MEKAQTHPEARRTNLTHFRRNSSCERAERYFFNGLEIQLHLRRIRSREYFICHACPFDLLHNLITTSCGTYKRLFFHVRMYAYDTYLKVCHRAGKTMDVLPTLQSTQAHDPEYLIHNVYIFPWLLCARSASHIFVGQPNRLSLIHI